MFSLGQRVQPATMIGFKQIEFFDHTGHEFEHHGASPRSDPGRGSYWVEIGDPASAQSDFPGTMIP